MDKYKPPILNPLCMIYDPKNAPRYIPGASNKFGLFNETDGVFVENSDKGIRYFKRVNGVDTELL